MSVIKITKSNFEKEVTESKIPVLLDFYADWCGPCRIVSPIVEEIASESSNYKVGKINVDDEQLLAQKFGVMSIPTLIVMKNGTISSKAVGYKSKNDILGMLNNK